MNQKEKKTACMLLKNGFEEIEAITTIDILRRGNVEVSTISCEPTLNVQGANGITVIADKVFSSVVSKNYSALLLPGGPAAFDLRKDPNVIRLIQEFHSQEKLIAAICAAPILLKEAKVLPGKYTSHFSVHAELPQSLPEAVVVSGNTITSQGPATTPLFAFAILKWLCEEEAIKPLWQGMRFDVLPLTL